VNDTVTLRGGARMPLLGFGTWQLRGRAAYEATLHALRAGYRHIDTATMYANEAEVGRALTDSGVPRDEVFLTTKLLPQQAGRAEEALDTSLAALGVARVDLWLIHSPPARDLPGVWTRLRAARDRGLTREIGVSNYSIAQIDEITSASGEAPAVNQIPWSPWQHSADRLAEHRERGVVLEGYSPFKRSDLRSPVLADIASAHGRTPAQVVLRWHLQHGIVVIPKSATPERIDENLDVYGFALTGDELATLDSLYLVPWS
jgi:diketogulonate reductase-like aldo/keto reductase